MFQEAQIKVLKAMFPIFNIPSKKKRKSINLNMKGTGFFIDDKGLFISASHIFEVNNEELTYLYKGIPSIDGINLHYEIKEVFRDQRLDLFIGRIQSKTPSYLELKSDLINSGDPVCLGGYPNPDYKVSWINTSISSKENLTWPKMGYFFLCYGVKSVPLPRMSGGPAFTPDGSVVGMITGSLNSKKGILLNSKTIIETIGQYYKKIWS